MKTISLTDAAYERLRAHAGGAEDSFSQVIEKYIPAKDHFAQILRAAQTLPDLSDEGFELLERDIYFGCLN